MPKKFFNFYFFLLLVVIFNLFLFPPQAYAYLDPGTGSLIIQGIIGGLAAVAVFAKIYWQRLLQFFGLRKYDSPDDSVPNLQENTDNPTSDTEEFKK
jgi:hypothetical protein